MSTKSGKDKILNKNYVDTHTYSQIIVIFATKFNIKKNRNNSIKTTFI